jgi:hypothetical protein
MHQREAPIKWYKGGEKIHKHLPFAKEEFIEFIVTYQTTIYWP